MSSNNNIWKKLKISECAEIICGGTPSTSKMEYWDGNIPWITPKDLSNYNSMYISKGNRNISELGLKNSSAKLLPKNTILLTTRAPIGYIAIAKNELSTNQGFKSLIMKDGNIPEFFYYLLKYNMDSIKNLGNGTTFMEVNSTSLKKLELNIPPLEKQKKIASILSSLDDKIELNNRMNKILEEMAQTIFKEWFVNFNFPSEEGKPYKDSGGKMIKSELGAIPDGWKVDSLSNVFDISIGKTPPRKEVECFSYDNKDIKWVSISDMGKSGLYILDTSEYLTPEAVSKYNVVIVPKDTIILSFKLTIGRVSIVIEDMTTNEAIAHIKTNDKKLNEYTYFYLKNFKYSTLGSTSSIAQAVNSKLIKSIKYIVPRKNILDNFHLKVRDIFNKIKFNQIENQKLDSIRDTLLPKLMSGEIRVK
ncbi:restriction endonuclease subunit S [Brachyspira innocens]|uniref:restriction endonuclease subunit S n=1 Tax=Brachyspira innocens TaxID=13264 RepID=UPI0026EE9F5F|nr:restriction endonuclease subunit S [Brachyspira innocens]